MVEDPDITQDDLYSLLAICAGVAATNLALPGGVRLCPFCRRFVIGPGKIAHGSGCLYLKAKQLILKLYP